MIRVRKFIILLLITFYFIQIKAENNLFTPALKGESTENNLLFSEYLKTKHDTDYYDNYYKNLIVRTYLSSKYTKYTILDKEINEALVYKPNSKSVFGLGFNYKFLSLNLGYGFYFLNHDNKLYGKTEYFDIQSHFYLKRITIDLWFHAFHSYYLYRKPKMLLTSSRIYRRGDMSTGMLGFDISYVFNHKQFTYKSAFTQTAHQKKSAGSLIAGLSANLEFQGADSLIIPALDTSYNFLNNYRYKNSSFVIFAPKIGYAYHYVFKENWFIAMSMLLGFGPGVSRFETSDVNYPTKTQVGLFFTNTIRFAAGYDVGKWHLGFEVINNAHNVAGPVEYSKLKYNSGSVRLCFVYRFNSK